MSRLRRLLKSWRLHFYYAPFLLGRGLAVILQNIRADFDLADALIFILNTDNEWTLSFLVRCSAIALLRGLLLFDLYITLSIFFVTVIQLLLLAMRRQSLYIFDVIFV